MYLNEGKIVLGVVGSLMILYAHGLYIISILKGKTKPNLITWSIWTIATTTVFFAQIMNNAGPGCWGLGVSVLTCSFITIITVLKKITSSIKKIDILLLLTSIFAIFLWWFTSDPLYSVIILTTIDVLGYIPTIRKTYYNPHQENISTYNISSLRHLLSLISLHQFSLVNVIFQIGMVTANSILTIVYLTRKDKQSSKL